MQTFCDGTSRHPWLQRGQLVPAAEMLAAIPSSKKRASVVAFPDCNPDSGEGGSVPPAPDPKPVSVTQRIPCNLFLICIPDRKWCPPSVLSGLC